MSFLSLSRGIGRYRMSRERSLDCSRRRRRAKARSLRALEELERRSLLSTTTWTNAAGGDWSTPSNWDNGVPGVNDDAVIPDFPGSITITYSASGMSEIHSLTCQETLAITNGTFQLDADSSTLNLSQSGGTFTGAGNMTVSSSFDWTGGTLTGDGATVLVAGALLTIEGTGTHYAGAHTIQGPGPVEWTAGTIQGGPLTIATDWTISGDSDKSLSSYGATLNNAGDVVWTGAGYLNVSGYGVFNNLAGATFDVQTDGYISGNGYSASAFNNAGTFRKTAGTGTTTINGPPLNNSGIVEVQTGTLNVSGAFSNFSGTTLTGGAYQISGNGILKFTNADIRTNAAAILLDGSSSQIVDQSNANALANFATNSSGGSFAIQNGRNFTTAGAFSNAGTLAVGTGSTFTASGNYTQTAGDTDLQGGKLAATGLVDLQGGVLSGSGAVSGNVNNAAAVGPGDSAGTISITGDYTQTSAGSLNIELGGASAGQFDVLQVSGTATLDGTLNVSLINGYNPAPPDSFQILTFGSRVGDFATMNGLDLGGGKTLAPTYDATSLTLTTQVSQDLYTVTTTADSGPGSLRQAIDNANAASSGPITISFQIWTSDPNFTGSVFVIQPSSELPALNNPSVGIIIDGRTQTAFTGDTNPLGPEIVLDGTIAGSASGLVIQSSGNEVHGLDIREFSGDGIDISSGSNNWIEGNFIGTDATGTTALGNGADGVSIVGAPGNQIGGAGAGNVISGNTRVGIYINGSGATGNVVAGNFIGTDAAGTAALGNGSQGVTIDDAPGNTVGGTDQAQRNVVSGNGQAGILIINSGATGNVVQGNYVGTDLTGTVALGNTADGIAVLNAANNTIGGVVAGAGNLSSGNHQHGVILLVSGATGNVVQGNLVGTDASGTLPLGNTGDGVAIADGSNNLIGGTAAGARNIISGNHQDGVEVTNAAATGNQIEGNFIGTDVTGTIALGNLHDGIFIGRGTTGNIVGGMTPGAGNIISGNGQHGVEFYISQQNVVAGNYLGTDATGMVALGNAGNGVQLDTGAANNTIGGLTAAERNVISGNGSNGIWINGASPDNNVVQGNFVGLNAAGTAAIGNLATGVYVSAGTGNQIGGSTSGARNVISGNGQIGVVLDGTATSSNLVQGNYIGTDATGAGGLGNVLDGVMIVGSSNNTIGGSTALERNVISGNNRWGVAMVAGASQNEVKGNFIGTNQDGTAALGNQYGVVLNGAVGNVVGTDGDGVGDDTEGNVISGNARNGVDIYAAGTDSNIVAGNRIGTNDVGTAALPNGLNGVQIAGGSRFNRVGTNGDGISDATERNIISGNANHGVAIYNTGTDSNIVAGNFIGVDGTGMTALGNGGHGVVLADGAAMNRIGSDGVVVDAERNIISGNTVNGVDIQDAGTTGNVVAGNYIGTDSTGTAALGNHVHGIVILNTSNNTIGGSTAAAGNVVSGNGLHGIIIASSQQNVVAANLIGTDASGTVALGNAGDGVAISRGANNLIGGTAAGARNVISGNHQDNVEIVGAAATGNRIGGNFIGTDVTGSMALGNAADGIRLRAGRQATSSEARTPGRATSFPATPAAAWTSETPEPITT
jgi:hypothetical protein